MGPTRDHISREVDWSHDWPETGPRELWRAQVGIGYSGVAVVGSRAYTMGHADGQETVFCFDTTSGASLWTVSYPAELMPSMHRGGPNATPTVHGDRVYALSKDGQLHALEAETGKIVWKASVYEAFGLERMTRWGFASSPVVAEDRLLFHANRALALDRETGQTLWRSPVDHKPGYSSVAVFDRGPARLMAALTGDRLMVFDRTSGATVAEHPFPADYNMNAMTPIVGGDGDWMFVSNSNPKGRAQRLSFDGEAFGVVYQNKSLRVFMNNPVLVDGHFYGIDGNHRSRSTRLVCVRLEDGARTWKTGGVGCGSLIAAGDRLIVLSATGELIVARADPKAFTPLARAQVLEKTCWTPPTLAHGRLFLRNDGGDLVCLDLRHHRSQM